MRPFQYTVGRGHVIVRFALVAIILSSLLPASAGHAAPDSLTAVTPPETTHVPQTRPAPRTPPSDFVPAPLRPKPPAQRPTPPERGPAHANAMPGLPIAFRPEGSASSSAERFTSEGPGWRAVFSATGVTLSLAAEAPQPPVFGKARRFLRPRPTPSELGGPTRPKVTVTIQFADVQGRTRLQGLGRLPAHTRVFQQTPPSGQAPLFARLRYRALYRGG